MTVAAAVISYVRDDMAMKENEAYGPVTSSQQPQDYAYAEASMTQDL